MVVVVGHKLGVATLLAVVGCYAGRGDLAGGDDEPTAGEDGGDDGDTPAPRACATEGDVYAVRAPLRRLTRLEYNNTVRDLLGDDTFPGNAFPAEEIGNGFGNDADAQSVSSLLAEQYSTVAEDIATRATETPAKLGLLAECAGDVSESTASEVETACAFALIEDLAARAYRRPLRPGEADELLDLQQAIRQEATFAESIAAVVAALLQSPDFLYRVEVGVIDEDGRRRPSGHEMATRLSYLFWGTMPDSDLFAAADSGELVTDEGVRAQAERLLADPRSRTMVRFFFDNLLPISALSALERDETRYPEYTAAIGALMREETQTFLEHEIFEGPGTWPDALTAPYTFVNAELAAYYGIEGVTGEEFRKVDLDTSQRLGLLTQAGVVSGTIHSNETNPVTRGSFVAQKLMCRQIPLPSGDVLAEVKPPDPDSGATARERYAQHSEDPVCAGCHSLMDPIGLAFENYDAIGRWRDTENGVAIDASGQVPGIEGTTTTPIELVQAIAAQPQTHECFAKHWANFAYGQTLGEEAECVTEGLQVQFAEAGYDIQTLLLNLTASDAFLYLPDEAAGGGQ